MLKQVMNRLRRAECLVLIVIARILRRSFVAALSVSALLLAVLAAVPLGARADAGIDEQQLLKQFGFPTQDLQRISRGEIVGRTTQADSSAVALVVAGTIAVPSSYYLERFRAIESFKKSAEILQLGRFGSPPSTADVASLTLDGSDVDDLRDCRVNDCGVKLDAQGIAALARRDARSAESSAAMRQYLAAYVRRYTETGHASLVEYRDDPHPKKLLDELRVILEQSSFLRQGWPALYGAVADFSGSVPEGLDDFVYWSKEKIGPRAVISVTHAIISPPANGAAAVATKQLYASHYSHASLGVTMLLDKGTPEAPRTLLIYVNRSRLDIFGGLLGSIKRPLVRSRARDGAERTMRLLRDRLEREYRTKSG
jgi:hypothetical protein